LSRRSGGCDGARASGSGDAAQKLFEREQALDMDELEQTQFKMKALFLAVI
jgi:hypothetical protein